MKLYELGDEMRAVHQLIADADGEMPPEVELQLDALQGQVEAKVNGLLALYKDEMSDGDALMKEAQALQERARVKINNANRLKAWLLNQLTAMGLKKVETLSGRVIVCKNSRPSIHFLGDVRFLPPQWTRTTVVLDTQAVYEHWKEFGQLPSDFAVEEGVHLRIT